jgi:hypothetical protein
MHFITTLSSQRASTTGMLCTLEDYTDSIDTLNILIVAVVIVAQ